MASSTDLLAVKDVIFCALSCSREHYPSHEQFCLKGLIDGFHLKVPSAPSNLGRRCGLQGELAPS